MSPEPVTHARIARSRALDLPCRVHGAASGEPCIGEHGVCMARYHAGVEAMKLAPTSAAFPDALAERAAAVRNSQLHARQREHERTRDRNRQSHTERDRR